MEFATRGTGSWLASEQFRSYAINRLNRDLWELVIRDADNSVVARLTADTKSQLRKWAILYESDPYALLYPEMHRVTRTQRLMRELDPNLDVRDTGWVSG